MSQGAGTGSLVSGVKVEGASFLDRYKSEQGSWVRSGTFGGAMVLILGLGQFLLRRLESYRDPERPWTIAISLGIPMVVAGALSLLAYWLVFKHHRCGDFLIATEGEMKKVNWSSRQEILGSTRVVILVTAMMSLTLFFIDFFFMWFFKAIGVLKLTGMALIGGGG